MTFTFDKKSQLVALATITNVEPISTTFAKMDDEKAKRFSFERVNHLNQALELGQTHMVHGGKEVPTCFITGGSLRAKIRHACADAVIQRRHEMGQSVGIREIYALKVGQVEDAISNAEEKENSGGKKIENDAFQYRAFRDANPLLSHFGLFKVGSTIAIGHAMPQEPVQPSMIGGARFDIDPQFILDNLSEEGQAEYLARKNRNANKSLLESEIKDLEKSYLKEMRACNNNKKLNLKECYENGELVHSETAKKLRESLDDKKGTLQVVIKDQGDMRISTQMPLNRHVVPPGHQFRSKMILRDLSDADSSSMWLHGLEALSRYPKIGAYNSTGGEIAMEIDLKLVDANGQVTYLGQLKVGAYQSIDTQGLTELGREWFEEARANKSWKDKIDLKAK